MTILLLNDNPVVNKLVTLSAQKTSDKLEAIESIRDIKNTSYDLLIIDDTKYTNSMLEEIKEKISFTTSLFICSKNAKEEKEFTSILRKPFLPTSLVELFAKIGKNIETVEANREFDLDEEHFDFDEELTLGEEDLDIETVEEGVLDKEELQEVQNLIDEAELEVDDNNKEELDIGEEFELLDDLKDDEKIEKKEEEFDIEEFELLDDLEDDEEIEKEEEKFDIEEFELPDDLEDDEEIEKKEEELVKEESDIEELELPDDLKHDEEITLEEAVNELTEEDLAQEIDDDMLIDISDLNSISSDDLKLAIGEELTNAQEDIIEDKEEVVESETSKELKSDTEITPNNNGVEALKILLSALSNEDVVASLKGMKININITLGDNYE